MNVNSPESLSEAPSFGLSRPTRVDLVQPALAPYRVAVFAELARRRNIDFHLHYGEVPNLANAQPDDFAGSPAPLRRYGLLGRTLTLQPHQWHVAARDWSTADRRVVMLLWDVQYLSSIAGLLRARKNGLGVVLWGHGYGKHETATRRRIRNAIGRLAHAVVVYDAMTAERLVHQGFGKDQVYVATNTLGTEEAIVARDAIDPLEQAAFERQHDLHDRPTFLLISRAAPERRADLLLEAAATLRDEGMSPRLVFIGSGWPEQLATDIARLKLADVVKMPGSLYGEPALAPWFAASTAVVLPAEAGLAVVHAMAHSKPVVTHYDMLVHAPEARVIVHEENGLLFRRGDAVSLAAALRRLIEEPGLRHRLGDNAARAATKKLTIANMVDGFIAAIEHAAAAGR